jgi:hypothetical protein
MIDVDSFYGDMNLARERPKEKIGLSVGGEVRTTRFPCYTKWLQLEGRLVSEVVGVLCEIHITQMCQ